MKHTLERFKSVLGQIKKENVLYYPGCMTKHAQKDSLYRYKDILSDLGVNYVMIEDLVCCGSPLKHAGFEKDFDEIKKKNLEILHRHNITKIITNCPHCMDSFRRFYGVEVEHILQTLENNKHKLISRMNEEVTFHDSCILSRKYGIIKEPRSVLRNAGLKLIEPKNCKEGTFCCGAGGGLKQNSPKVADAIAKERLKQMPRKKVVVACPYCYAHLKENATAIRNEIVELSELFVE